MITIRRLQTHAEYRAVERVQKDVWQLDDSEIIPDHLLLTAQKNGGLVLGAFAPTSRSGDERLIGFVFGFLGFTAGGRVKHCSHLAGVLPAYQNQNVGYRLKLAQREHVLAQGLDLITWTFDPLESRNGRLNVHKLGAICNTYLRDLYGQMRDELNAGLPSDRFQVDWHVASPHVTGRLGGEPAKTTPARRVPDTVPVVNPSPDGRAPCPGEVVRLLEGPQLLIQIPADFQALKRRDIAQAQAWRQQTRALFEAAFGAGYVVTDLLFEAGSSYYLVEGVTAQPAPVE